MTNWLVSIRVVPDSAISNPTGAGSGFGENLFWGSHNNTPDETKGVNNAVSCYTEAVVQYSPYL